MKKIEMIFDFKNKNWIWDDIILPMWRARFNIPKPTLNISNIKQITQQTEKPRVTREETKCFWKFLDSKYKNVKLKDISQIAHQLDVKEQVMIPHLLKEF